MEKLTDENISKIREAWYMAIQAPCSKNDIKILVGKPISPTKRVPDAWESAAFQTLSPQSGESTPEVEPAATQRR